MNYFFASDGVCLAYRIDGLDDALTIVLVNSLGTAKHFSPFLDDAPAASRAILRGSMWVDFDRDHLLDVRFVFIWYSLTGQQRTSSNAISRGDRTHSELEILLKKIRA